MPKTVTVHVCSECRHDHLDHPEVPHAKNTCSYAWCSCPRARAEVVETEPLTTRNLIPAKPTLSAGVPD